MRHDDPDYQDRTARALYAIQQQRGNGTWNLAHIEHILTGKDRG